MLEAEKSPWGGREEWEGIRIEENGLKIGNKILEKYQNTVGMAEKENKGKITSESGEEEIRHHKKDSNNQGKEETEKERENRIRHERREKKYIQKDLSLNCMQKREEENIDRMEISKKEEHMEGATVRRGKVSGDTRTSGEQGKQGNNIIETRGNEIIIERQSSEKRGKRKSEADKEENRKKKGRENEEQSSKERSLKQMEEKIQEVLVREVKIIGSPKGKENNAKTVDLYEWESNREEYLISISLNKEKMSINKKGNLIKIYNILFNTGIKFESIKMVGFNRAEVKYKNRQDANRILEESRLKPVGYVSYIPPRWKDRKGVIHEWEGSIENLEKQIATNQGIFTLEKLKKKENKGR